MDNTILVLGSNSFSGSHFIAHALASGYRVIGASRSTEPHPVYLAHRWGNCNNYAFHQIDLNHDLDALMDCIHNERPPYVVNFAAQGMVAESWQHPEHWFQTNTLAQVRLDDRLRKCDFLRKYVHISTPEVYGSTEGVIEESTVYTPSTPYAVSRAAADLSLMSFFRAYDFPVVFTRAANVYGPGQQLYRIIPRACMVFTTGDSLELHGDGHSVRSFIHIRDVADATLRVMENANPGEIFHISTDRRISIRDLVHLTAKIVGVSPDKYVKVTGERLGKDAAYSLDSGKIRREMGWNDTVSLENGIQETLTWVRNNITELCRQPQRYIHKK